MKPSYKRVASNYIKAVIKKCPEKDKDDRPDSQQKWCLYTRDGDKLLGRHPSKEKALKQEWVIRMRKHSSDLPEGLKTAIEVAKQG